MGLMLPNLTRADSSASKDKNNEMGKLATNYPSFYNGIKHGLLLSKPQNSYEVPV